MKKAIFCLIFLFGYSLAIAQLHDFKFGMFNYAELNMKKYELDTTANAVVLNEFGEAYIESDNDFNLIYQYHVRIKILKAEGLDEANITIPLKKQDDKEETLRSVEASSFTLVEGSAVETKLKTNNVFSEKRNANLTLKKFAIANIKVGSVIEVSYTIETPFFYKFWPWYFQSKLPKIRSEYWATIPGNYIYNISLNGFLTLSKNESEIEKECFSVAGQKADCVRYKFVMENIPAFVEEEYMTAASNFISAVNFELVEIRYFDGRVDKITKEWKDVEEELRRDDQFGAQIKKGKDIIDDHVEQILIGESDSLGKAKKIFDFIKNWYQWNEGNSKYSYSGIRKAFESKKGNVGDINLSLIAALKYAKLDADPMILSTRENGLPIELFPVLTDFNYVIAKLNIGNKVYLLDATDQYNPFGVLPVRCLNGKGRVLAAKESYWYEIKPSDKRKQVTVLSLKLDNDGFLKGTIDNTYIGYDAINKRKEIASFLNQKEYIEDLDNKWSKVMIKNFQLSNLENLDKPVSEKLEVEIEGFDDLKAPTLYFNPFISKHKDNPFKSNVRLYPVDFGTQVDVVTILTLELPQEFELAELPSPIAIGLPNRGGRYIYEVKTESNKVSLNSSFAILKPIFSAEEYHYLKEFYARIIQAQNADLVLKRRTK